MEIYLRAIISSQGYAMQLYAFIGQDLEQREYVVHTKQYDSDHALYKNTLLYFLTVEYVNNQSKMQLK